MLARAAGVETLSIGALGTVVHPNRFKRQLAAPAEKAAPFLRAFDVFEYLPQPADRLSVSRTAGIESLRVQPGTILLTRSGRNLGPAVMTDEYLARFIPSDDLIRVSIKDRVMAHYVLAFLNSDIGQALLRQDKTGSVIDHLSADQVSAQQVPLFDADMIERIASAMKRCIDLRGRARTILSEALQSTNERYPAIRTNGAEGWSTRAVELHGRLDAAAHQTSIRALRDVLREAGGQCVGDVATIVKPAGRYKTYYVDSEHGRPLLSGRNLLQVTPIAPKHISVRSINDPSRYELTANSVAFQADGRAEEHLGFPVVVTSERHGWLGSGHVGRVIPHDNVSTGALWCGFAADATQVQLAAVACGSVVDALYEEDIASVVLPPLEGIAAGSAVEVAWSLFAEAAESERAAVDHFASAVDSAIASS